MYCYCKYRRNMNKPRPYLLLWHRNNMRNNMEVKLCFPVPCNNLQLLLKYELPQKRYERHWCHWGWIVQSLISVKLDKTVIRKENSYHVSNNSIVLTESHDSLHWNMGHISPSFPCICTKILANHFIALAFCYCLTWVKLRLLHVKTKS